VVKTIAATAPKNIRFIMTYPLQLFIKPVNCQIFYACAIRKVATALWRLPNRQ